MTTKETETKNDKPTHRGRIQVSAWTKVDKNGNKYLSIKMDQYFNLFPVKEDVI